MCDREKQHCHGWMLIIMNTVLPPQSQLEQLYSEGGGVRFKPKQVRVERWAIIPSKLEGTRVRFKPKHVRVERWAFIPSKLEGTDRGDVFSRVFGSESSALFLAHNFHVYTYTYCIYLTDNYCMKISF